MKESLGTEEKRTNKMKGLLQQYRNKMKKELKKIT